MDYRPTLSCMETEFFYSSFDGKRIFAKHWADRRTESKAVIQLSHGLGETAHYYEEFAAFAVSRGYDVYINEARGHGRTAGDVNGAQYLAEAGDAGEDGFFKMREDLYLLTLQIKSRHPGAPVFMLAHSMGTVVARLYAAAYGGEISGLILTGAPRSDSKTQVLLALLDVEIAENGLKAPSRAAFELAFKDVNKPFEPVLTPLDWITSDRSMTEESLLSPYINVLFTNGFYRDYYRALREVRRDSQIKKYPSGLPLYLLTGAQDVITENGKSTEKQYRQFIRIGLRDVSFKVYAAARHSLLREINRKQVMEDIIEWLAKRGGEKTGTVRELHGGA